MFILIITSLINGIYIQRRWYSSAPEFIGFVGHNWYWSLKLSMLSFWWYCLESSRINLKIYEHGWEFTKYRYNHHFSHHHLFKVDNIQKISWILSVLTLDVWKIVAYLCLHKETFTRSRREMNVIHVHIKTQPFNGNG
jgi:hypothetical protein